MVEPKAVARLKNRERLVDFGLRKELLEQTEQVLAEKRTPKNVAENAVGMVTQRAQEVGAPVMQDRVEKRISSVFNK